MVVCARVRRGSEKARSSKVVSGRAQKASESASASIVVSASRAIERATKHSGMWKVKERQ